MTDKELFSRFLIEMDNRHKADPSDISKVVIDWSANKVSIYRKANCAVFDIETIIDYMKNKSTNLNEKSNDR